MTGIERSISKGGNRVRPGTTRMRVAVLGCGSIGRRHLQNLQSLNCAELLAYDPVPAACQPVQNELGIPCLVSLGQLWDREPDAVLVAAPTNVHLELALAAACQDAHLFIEKPLSYSLDGLDELCTEVERRDLITMVGCNMRFHPGPMMVKKLLDERAIGEVMGARIQTGSYLPSWRPGQDYRHSYSASREWGGAILDCIHEIDLALWYFGPAEVIGAAHAPARTLGLETEGLAEILLRHQSGVLSNVHLNFVQRDYRRTCQVIGSQGTIYWDYGEHQVRVYGEKGEPVQSLPGPEGWSTNKMYIDELFHFLDAAQNHTSTVNPIEGGLAALRVALAARQRQLGGA